MKFSGIDLFDDLFFQKSRGNGISLWEFPNFATFFLNANDQSVSQSIWLVSPRHLKSSNKDCQALHWGILICNYPNPILYRSYFISSNLLKRALSGIDEGSCFTHQLISKQLTPQLPLKPSNITPPPSQEGGAEQVVMQLIKLTNNGDYVCAWLEALEFTKLWDTTPMHSQC